MAEHRLLPPDDLSKPPRRRRLGFLALAALTAATAVGGGRWGRTGLAAPPEPAPAEEPSLGGVKLFAQWPKGAAPDAVIVLSGQSFGLLQPCGCSRPQLGGLERRANFMSGLRAKGWPVVGVDLGDLFPAKTLVPEQARMKYVASMKALKDMGYVAVGLGKSELDHGLIQVLGAYALQKADPPQILAGNLVGMRNGQVVPRDQEFPRGNGLPAMVELTTTLPVGGVPVGIAGVVGPSLAKAQGGAALIGFEGNDKALPAALAEFAANKLNPQVRVLIYQGTVDEAKKTAEAFPEFPVVLCQSDDPEPPQFPTRHAGPKHAAGQQTLIIEVGHKGRYVGALGVFKRNGSYEFYYQLVPLTEQFLTPNDPQAEKADKVLALLEDYSAQVKARDILGKTPQQPHPNQIEAGNANLAYVGSEKCMGCHAQEFMKWRTTPHSHAFDALEKVAKRPGLRNFDPECVQCHVVGFGYQTGYRDEGRTPAMRHVGCESCHGPGSGHVAEPKNKRFLELMSRWKKDPKDRLPDAATMQRLAELNPVARGQVQIPPAQQRVINVVSSLCMRCHDQENDPHFDLFKYWPKIDHTGLANGGLPPAAGRGRRRARHCRPRRGCRSGCRRRGSREARHKSGLHECVAGWSHASRV